MPVIELDTTLKPVTKNRIADDHGSHDARESFILQQSDRKKDWRTGVTTQTLFPVENNLSADPSTILHRNYLEYLEYAWGSHLGVVLTPDIIWYTLLCEITTIIAENPSVHRHLFTTSPNKETISVGSDSPTVIPLDSIMNELRERVPDGFADSFLGDFSTTDNPAREAKFAAFADAVSPYYSYMMFCCGIPYVDLRGEIDDWTMLLANWTLIAGRLSVATDYVNRVTSILGQIVSSFATPDPSFLRGIFRAERCGSGSQTEVSGWFTDLYRVHIDGPRFSHNFAPHIAKVDYTHINSGRSFRMLQGLFASRTEDSLLSPTFGRIVFEERKNQS